MTLCYELIWMHANFSQQAIQLGYCIVSDLVFCLLQFWMKIIFCGGTDYFLTDTKNSKNTGRKVRCMQHVFRHLQGRNKESRQTERGRERERGRKRWHERERCKVCLLFESEISVKWGSHDMRVMVECISTVNNI